MKILKLLIVSFIYFNLNCIIPKTNQFNLTIKNQSNIDLSGTSIIGYYSIDKKFIIKANTTKSFKVTCISLLNVYDLKTVSIAQQQEKTNPLCVYTGQCQEPNVLSSFNWCPEKDLTLIFDGTKLYQEVDSSKTN